MNINFEVLCACKHCKNIHAEDASFCIYVCTKPRLHAISLETGLASIGLRVNGYQTALAKSLQGDPFSKVGFPKPFSVFVHEYRERFSCFKQPRPGLLINTFFVMLGTLLAKQRSKSYGVFTWSFLRQN